MKQTSIVKGAAGMILPDGVNSAVSAGMTLHEGETIPEKIRNLTVLLDGTLPVDFANESILVSDVQRRYNDSEHYQEAGMDMVTDGVTLANPLLGGALKVTKAANDYANAPEGPTNQEKFDALYEFATKDKNTITAEDVVAAIKNNPKMDDEDLKMIIQHESNPTSTALDEYVRYYVKDLLPKEPLLEGQEPLEEGESYIAYITRGIQAGWIKPAEFMLDKPGFRDPLTASISMDRDNVENAEPDELAIEGNDSFSGSKVGERFAVSEVDDAPPPAGTQPPPAGKPRPTRSGAPR